MRAGRRRVPIVAVTAAVAMAAPALLGACSTTGSSGSAGAPITATATAAVLHAPCSAAEVWDGAACRAAGRDAVLLDEGAAALAEFKVEEALPLLRRAEQARPHRHAEHVRLYEQLGIAHAYLGDEAASLAAFEMLLALDPRHLLSYRLSPKATFLFERARDKLAAEKPTTIQLSWPRDLDTDSEIPIDIEVVADPRSFLRRASLFVRRQGDPALRLLDVALPAAGDYRKVRVPALRSARAETLDVFLIAYDDQGNEVLRWASEDSPRRIALAYKEPARWYRKWWVWAIAGAVVAGGTGGLVYGLTVEPSATVGGSFRVSP